MEFHFEQGLKMVHGNTARRPLPEQLALRFQEAPGVVATSPARPLMLTCIQAQGKMRACKPTARGNHDHIGPH